MDTYDPAELFMDAGRKLGGPMELPYDPVAVADYIQRKRGMGQVPLFTDDPRLAAKEDGFFINTGAGASAQADEPTIPEFTKTGDPIVDKFNEGKLALLKENQIYERDVAKALETTPQARNLAMLNRQLATAQSMGVMSDPQKVQMLSAQIQIAQQAYKLTKDNLEATPLFANRKQRLDMLKASSEASATAVQSKLEENEALRQGEIQLGLNKRQALQQGEIQLGFNKKQALQELDLNKLRQKQNLAFDKEKKLQELERSPELNGILSDITGAPAEQIAEELYNGNITPKELEVATQINEGNIKLPASYIFQGDAETGSLVSRYVIAKAKPEDRARLQTVSSALIGQAQVAMEEAAAQATGLANGTIQAPAKDTPEEKLLTQYTASTSSEARKNALAQLTSHLYQTKIAAQAVKIKHDIINSNPEILRPEASWSSREAEIGNKIVDMIRNNSSTSLEEKLSYAVGNLADNGVYGITELNDTIKKMTGAYVRRFNDDYKALGLDAGPGDLKYGQISLLTRILNDLGIRPMAGEFSPDQTGTVNITQEQVQRYTPNQGVTLDIPSWQSIRPNLQFGPKLTFPPAQE